MNGHTAAIAVIIVLFAFSAVLALSETAFVRASRIRMLNLAEEGDNARRTGARLLEHPEQTLNSVLLVLLALPDGVGDVARHRARADLRHRRRRDRHASSRSRSSSRSRKSRRRRTRCSTPTARCCGVGAARVPHELRAAAAPHARFHRPGQHRAARSRVCEADRSSPRNEILTMADVAARGGVDRDRGARAHPLDLRVRRHGRARGDGAAARHGRGRRRRDRRRGDPHR